MGEETKTIFYAGIIFEFRLIDQKLEHRLLNVDKMPLDNHLGEWRPTTEKYLKSMKTEFPELIEWLGNHNYPRASYMVGKNWNGKN